MTRTDRRLIVMLLACGFVCSVATVVASRLLTDNTGARFDAIERRLSKVEMRESVIVPTAPVAPIDPIAPIVAAASAPNDEPDDSPDCDEVSCVLNDYEPACCAPFVKRIPDALDRAMISEGVSMVKSQIAACSKQSSARGTVKVSVRVNPDGSVATSTPRVQPDRTLGSCVAKRMARAKFAKTRDGGSFAYPFVF